MNTFCIALMFLFNYQLLYSQWYQQSSGTTNRLLDVYFYDANDGAAVGDLGTILTTTNGGTNWIPQQSGITNNLFGVYFSNVDFGIAIGISGIILKTTNGGISWNQQQSGTTNDL